MLTEIQRLLTHDLVKQGKRADEIAKALGVQLVDVERAIAGTDLQELAKRKRGSLDGAFDNHHAKGRIP